MAASAAVVAEHNVRTSVDGKTVILVNDGVFGDSLPDTLELGLHRNDLVTYDIVTSDVKSIRVCACWLPVTLRVGQSSLRCIKITK